MKIYLAARYDRRAELRVAARDLQDRGHTITSEWIYVNHDHEPYSDKWAIVAQRDILDIEDCDALILWTEQPDQWYPRGSRHFEAGFAYGRDKIVLTVGPQENVFYWMRQIPNFADWDECRSQVFDRRRYG